MLKMAKIWHFDPKNTTKNLSIRPNQLRGNVLGTQMTLLIKKISLKQDLQFFLAHSVMVRFSKYCSGERMKLMNEQYIVSTRRRVINGQFIWGLKISADYSRCVPFGKSVNVLFFLSIWLMTRAYMQSICMYEYNVHNIDRLMRTAYCWVIRVCLSILSVNSNNYHIFTFAIRLRMLPVLIYTFTDEDDNDMKSNTPTAEYSTRSAAMTTSWQFPPQSNLCMYL